MVMTEVIADDQRRRHVHEARTDAVQETVRKKQPLRLSHKRRSDTADSQQHCAEQTADPVAVSGTQRAYDAD